MKQALGLVEISGLSTAVVAADTMAKAANIRILEIENTKGLGYMTIKIAGDVGAVNAAVNAGKQIGAANNKLVSWKVIPRPSDYVEQAFCCPDPPVPPTPPIKEGQEETQTGKTGETMTERPETSAEAEQAGGMDTTAAPEPEESGPGASGPDAPEPEESESEESEPDEPEPAATPEEKPKKAVRRASSAKGNSTTRQKNS